MSVACRHVKFSVPLVEQAVDTARGLFEDLVEDGIDEVRRRVGENEGGRRVGAGADLGILKGGGTQCAGPYDSHL